MTDSRINRWMGPLGLLTVVAIFIGVGPLGGNAPSENASGPAVVNYYNSHVAQSWASVYVIGLGLALLIVFVTQLRSVLRETGGQNLLPNLVFASGIILVAGVVADGANQVVLILAAHNNQYTIARFANFFGQNNELPFVFGLALLGLTTGAAILLNRAEAPLPRTLGWWSLLVGVVVCLGPIGFLAILFGFPIWILAIGFVITVKSRRNTLLPTRGLTPQPAV
jgi:hypothetical protein